MRTRKAVAIPAAVIAVLVILVIVVIVWTRGGTPVPKKDAVDDFRRTSTTQNADAADDESEEPKGVPLVPDVGVYSYDASGNQEVKFGPLPADPRVLPDEIVASVKHVDGPTDDQGSAIEIDADSSCFSFELRVFTEHAEEMTTCVAWDADSDDDTATRATIATHLILMKIGPVTATAHLECEEPLIMAKGWTQTDVPCVLRLTGAPVEVVADLVGSVTVGEAEDVDIAGTTVRALPVKIAYDANSKVTGSWGETVWMSEENWLPLKFDRDINLQGTATIIEKSSLVLSSLLPDT